MRSWITRSAAVAAMAAMMAFPAAAQPVSCANASSQFDLNRCAGLTFKTEDAGLNKIYSQLLAKQTAAGKLRLRDAQRAWVAFRDKQCAFESQGSDGGSVAPMVVANCAAGLTATRAQDLARIGVCVEGDVSCAR